MEVAWSTAASNTEKAALIAVLPATISADHFPLSPCSRMLQQGQRQRRYRG
jgi:hypothetical protein